MPNFIGIEKLATFSSIYEALCKAPQFVHWSDEDLSFWLNSLYEENDDAFDWDWLDNHQLLIKAYRQGYLKEKLYDVRSTIKAIAASEGTVCLLCFQMSSTQQFASIDDGCAKFENMLTITYGGEPSGVSPDIYCSKCRYHVRERLTQHYIAGYKKHEAYNLQLASLIKSKTFLERCEKNRTTMHRHKFKIKRIET